MNCFGAYPVLVKHVSALVRKHIPPARKQPLEPSLSTELWVLFSPRRTLCSHVLCLWTRFSSPPSKASSQLSLTSSCLFLFITMASPLLLMVSFFSPLQQFASCCQVMWCSLCPLSSCSLSVPGKVCRTDLHFRRRTGPTRLQLSECLKQLFGYFYCQKHTSKVHLDVTGNCGQPWIKIDCVSAQFISNKPLQSSLEIPLWWLIVCGSWSATFQINQLM